MTIRPSSRSSVPGSRGGKWAGFLAALALLAPLRAHAQDMDFRSTITVGAGPVLPLNGVEPHEAVGSTYVVGLAVGDDFSTVGFSLGFTCFSSSPFERRGVGVTQFELRADCTPRAPKSFSPFLRLGGGAYGVDNDRSIVDTNRRLVGISTGVGLRWAPRWHSAITLVASYINVPARKQPTRQWVSVSLELLRWMD